MSGLDIGGVTDIVAGATYIVLGLVALWGAFCVVVVWMRVAQKRFRNEQAQAEFLDLVDAPLARGDFPSAEQLCEDDLRATSQLALLAMVNRDKGYTEVRQLVLDRFQKDVLSDLEYRLSWVYTVIKAAPMVGLFGTVIGMMGAFAKLSAAESVKPEMLADNISVALITTASGLAIAIPLVFCTAAINVRIRKMEDLVQSGLTRFFPQYRQALQKAPKRK